MKLSHEHKTALRALRGLSPQERLQAMWEQEQQDLHEAEQSKELPLKVEFSPEEWNDFKAHLLDGGGVHDAHRVVRTLLQAVLEDDQATFWPELVHLLKSAGKHLGIIHAQDGHVTLNGVGPTLPVLPEMEKENHHVGH